MTCPIHGEESVPNCNFCIGRTTGKITLDRLRIVRNAIVRQWQEVRGVHDQLPENAFSKKGLRREMAGLRMALEELYGEFPELERIPMDQKPRCPFCQEEMDHPALADHMLEHVKKGDKIRGISPAAPGLPLDPSILDSEVANGLLMSVHDVVTRGSSHIRAQGTPASEASPWMGIPSIGPRRGPGFPLHSDDKFTVQFVDDSLIEVIIHGIKYKHPSKKALKHAIHVLENGPHYGHPQLNTAVASYLRSKAGGQGDAMHPDQNPDSPNPDPSPEEP